MAASSSLSPPRGTPASALTPWAPAAGRVLRRRGPVVAVTLALLAIYLVRALLVPAPGRIHGTSILSPLFTWDGGWYLRITLTGYHQLPGVATQPFAFFPLLPAAAAAVSALLPFVEIHLVGLGVVVVLVCGAMLVLDAAVGEWPEWQRLGMVALMLTLPGGFQYATFMSEAPFAFGVALVTWSVLREDHEWVAGLGVAIATMARPNGVILLVPLVMILAGRRRLTAPAGLVAVAIALGGLAAVLVTYFVASGDPFKYVSAHQQGWSYARGISYLGMVIGHRADTLAILQSQAAFASGSIVVITVGIWEGLLVTPLIFIAWRWNRGLGLVALAMWLGVMAFGGFESHMRYLLVVLPMWLAPLALYRSRARAWVVAAAFGLLGLALNWYLLGEFVAGRFAS